MNLCTWTDYDVTFNECGAKRQETVTGWTSKGVPHQQPLTGVFFFGVSKEVLAMGRALWREPLREGKGSEMMRGGLHRSMISLQARGAEAQWDLRVKVLYS